MQTSLQQTTPRVFCVLPEDMESLEGLPIHGPLACGEEIPLHTHSVPGAYVAFSKVSAFCEGTETVLGPNEEHQGLLVPAGMEHGWKAREDGVTIVQIHGEPLIQRLLPDVLATHTA